MKLKDIIFNKFININEIIFDIGIILYTKFILYGVFFKTGLIIDYFTNISAIIFIFLMDIFIPWYCGILYRNYDKHITSKFIKKIIIGIFVILSLYLFIGIIVQLIECKLLIIKGWLGILLFGGTPILIALGGIMGNREVERPDVETIYFEEDDLTYPTAFIMGFCIIIWTFFLVYLGEKYEVGTFMGIIGVIIWIAVSIGIALLFFLINKLKARFLNYLVDKGLYPYLFYGIRVLLFPMLVATLMSIWMELSISSALKSYVKESGKVSHINIMLPFILSGFIPLRILILFAPPIRLLNLVLAAATFYYFISSLLKLTL